MARKIFITERMKDIYVEKFYGKKLSEIQSKYKIKNHSLIYHYVETIENEMQFCQKLKSEIQKKRNDYKRSINN